MKRDDRPKAEVEWELGVENLAKAEFGANIEPFNRPKIKIENPEQLISHFILNSMKLYEKHANLFHQVSEDNPGFEKSERWRFTDAVVEAYKIKLKELKKFIPSELDEATKQSIEETIDLFNNNARVYAVGVERDINKIIKKSVVNQYLAKDKDMAVKLAIDKLEIKKAAQDLLEGKQQAKSNLWKVLGDFFSRVEKSSQSLFPKNLHDKIVKPLEKMREFCKKNITQDLLKQAGLSKFGLQQLTNHKSESKNYSGKVLEERDQSRNTKRGGRY